jgi:hypothetical protein
VTPERGKFMWRPKAWHSGRRMHKGPEARAQLQGPGRRPRGKLVTGCKEGAPRATQSIKELELCFKLGRHERAGRASRSLLLKHR